jgi:hypothetical protein
LNILSADAIIFMPFLRRWLKSLSAAAARARAAQQRDAAAAMPAAARCRGFRFFGSVCAIDVFFISLRAAAMSQLQLIAGLLFAEGAGYYYFVIRFR